MKSPDTPGRLTGVLAGLIFSWVAVLGKPLESGVFEACLSGLADGFSSSVVFVVGGDVADAGVQPNRVVVRSDGGELGAQGGWVADREQVRVLGLDVPVEAFDPGLVGRRAGASEVLGDRAQRQELPG
jgi:hypothetical protein